MVVPSKQGDSPAGSRRIASRIKDISGVLYDVPKYVHSCLEWPTAKTAAYLLNSQTHTLKYTKDPASEVELRPRILSSSAPITTGVRDHTTSKNFRRMRCSNNRHLCHSLLLRI